MHAWWACPDHPCRGIGSDKWCENWIGYVHACLPVVGAVVAAQMDRDGCRGRRFTLRSECTRHGRGHDATNHERARWSREPKSQCIRSDRLGIFEGMSLSLTSRARGMFHPVVVACTVSLHCLPTLQKLRSIVPGTVSPRRQQTSPALMQSSDKDNTPVKITPQRQMSDARPSKFKFRLFGLAAHWALHWLLLRWEKWDCHIHHHYFCPYSSMPYSSMPTHPVSTHLDRK